MIKACIFDLDGVIVDTAKYHFIAWRRMANELGYDFDEEQNEGLKGVGRMESLDLILEWGGIEKSQEEKLALAEKKNGWYRELLIEMNPSEIIDGILPFMDDLKENKIGIALGSASKNAMTILNKLDLVQRFDIIIDGTKTTRSKPDPQVFQMGAAALNVQPKECIVFEDAPKGIEAAIDGGFYAIGIGEPEFLTGAHFVVPNLKGLYLNHIITKIR